jgi:TctA family transporter
MIDDLEENRVAGGSLVVGFAAMIALLYRNPSAGFAAATADAMAVASFAVLPIAGLIAGAYVFADGPFETVLRFVFGSYLGIVGIGVAFGSLVSTIPNAVFLGLGFVMLGLAVVALGTIAVTLQTAVDRLEPSVPSE